LGGVRGLRGNDLNEKQRLIQRQSDEWVRRNVQQRDNVYVVIESLDKNSNFVGHMFLGSSKSSKNLSLKLLEEGWCEIFINAARRSKYFKPLQNAEAKAKEARKGMWIDFVEVEEDVKPDASGAPRENRGPAKHALEGAKLKATVTYVESATELFVVFTGEKQYDDNYNRVTNYMKTVNPAVNQIQANPFQAGDLVAGLFSGAYYRCRISSIRRKDRIHNVRFVDFGNRGQLRQAEILPLERFDKNGIPIEGSDMKSIPPLARRCRLAGLKPPPEQAADYCNSAGMFFAENAFGDVELEVLQVRRERKFEVFEVEVKKDGVCLNEEMVQQGWCRVDDKAYNMWGGGRDNKEAKYPNRKKTLNELQDQARQQHRGMFQYGNVDSDDEM